MSEGKEQMQTFTVGQLARKAGVNIETVRFYEKRGLLPVPRRTKSGYRQYTPTDVARLLFVKRARELGFSLREITELLSLKVESETTCGDVKRIAINKRMDIEAKIRDLQRIKKVLEELIAVCDQENSATDECPILAALEMGSGWSEKEKNK